LPVVPDDACSRASFSRGTAAQVDLGHERELREVSELLHVVRVDADGIAFLAEGRHVVISVPQRPLQPLQLQRRDLVAAGGFYRVQVTGTGVFDGHSGLLADEF